MANSGWNWRNVAGVVKSSRLNLVRATYRHNSPQGSGRIILPLAVEKLWKTVGLYLESIT